MSTPTTASYVQLRNEFLAKEEGFNSSIYLDGSGYATTGFGMALKVSTGMNTTVVDTLRAHVSESALFNKVVTAIETLGASKSELQARFKFEATDKFGNPIFTKFLVDPCGSITFLSQIKSA